MSLFVLREGYRVITTDKGGRVMHVRTGDVLELSATEVALLARATAGGVDPEDPSVKPVFKKLANLGLLVKGPGGEKPKGGVPAFDELSIDLDDVIGPKPVPAGSVPKFRADVAISRRGTTNLYDAADPRTGLTLTLYDFEVSLARMLDGKRSHAELLEAAKKLGIPASAESLGQFLEQLEKNGFLVSPGTPEAPGSAWPERKKWSPHVRQHFQLGLKLSREGRYNDAILAFDLVLAEDPGNPEATEALSNAKVHLESLTGGPGAPGPAASTPDVAPQQSPPRIPSVNLPPAIKPATGKFPAARPLADATHTTPTQPGVPAAAPASSYELDVPELDAGPPEAAKAPSADDLGTGATRPSQPALRLDAAGRATQPKTGQLYAASAVPPPDLAAAQAKAASATTAQTAQQPAYRPAALDAAAAAVPAAHTAQTAQQPAYQPKTEPEAVVEELTELAPLTDESTAPAEPAAELTEQAPPKGRSVSLPVYAVSLLIALALGWFAGMRTAPSEAPAGPRTVVPPVATGPLPVKTTPPAVTPAPAVEDSGTVEAAAPAVVDAGPAAAEVAEVVDAGAPPSVEKPEVAAAPVDSGPAKTAEPTAEWTLAKILKRGRVAMGTIEASAAGTVAWSAKKEAEVKRGAVVGKLTTESGKVELTAPKAGLFMPTAADGATVAAGAPLASIVYIEGFIQATVELPKPFAAWTCEVADKGTGQTAPCRVVTAVPKGAGLFITATTDPLWFDTASAPELRLAEGK